ncbi:MAG: CARDB domain-containing protein, partial [Anaerolineae bacterium]
TADDLGDAGWDPQFGYGLVDALEAALSVNPPDPILDLAITAIQAPETARQGDAVQVNVTLTNVGNEIITTDIRVALAVDGSEADAQFVTPPAPGESDVVTLGWDTAGVSIGDHTLTASHDLVDDRSTNDSLSTVTTVELPAIDITVDTISPSTISSGTTTDVIISGAGFASNAAVSFEGGRGPSPDPADVTVVDDQTIGLTIVAKAPKTTVWDVRVTNPDGASGVLLNGLTVQP